MRAGTRIGARNGRNGHRYFEEHGTFERVFRQFSELFCQAAKPDASLFECALHDAFSNNHNKSN
jgi:hypothetical protein